MSFADLIGDRFCKFLTVRLIRIFIEHSRKLVPADRIQPLRRTDSCFLIQPQIKRSVHFKGKSTLRIVNLHRRNPKICQNKIKAAHFFCNLVNRTEILQMHGQYILAKSLLCQTFFRLCRFYRVDIGRMDVSLPLQLLEHSFCVTAIAKCGIKPGLSRLNLQKIKNFFYHNRNMHTRRRIALFDHMCNGIFVFFRLQFFVFFLKFLWVFSFVTHAPLVYGLVFVFHFYDSFPLLSRYSSSYHLQGKTLYEVAKVLFAE